MSGLPHQSKPVWNPEKKVNYSSQSPPRKRSSPDFAGSVTVYYVEGNSIETRWDFYRLRRHRERALQRLPVEEPVWFMPEQFDSSPIKNQAAEQENSGLHLFNQQI